MTHGHPHSDHLSRQLAQGNSVCVALAASDTCTTSIFEARKHWIVPWDKFGGYAAWLGLVSSGGRRLRRRGLDGYWGEELGVLIARCHCRVEVLVFFWFYVFWGSGRVGARGFTEALS